MFPKLEIEPFCFDWRASCRDNAWMAGQRLLDLALPPHCAFCGDSNRPTSECADVSLGICPGCLQQFGKILHPCPRCAAPRPQPSVQDESACPLCRPRRYAFHGAVAGGAYQDDLQEAILRLKSGRSHSLAAALGDWMAARWRQERPARHPDRVVAVPSHWQRRWSRGSNPAELLGLRIARLLRVPLARQALRVRRKSKKQGTLSLTKRIENVRHLFRVPTGYSLGGLRILLVDDVMSTGATASEAARALRRAGARRVDVLVAARGLGV